VEERVAGQHVRAREEPFVETAVLFERRVQFLPHVDPSARGPKTREAQLGAVVRGELLKFVELFDRLSVMTTEILN